MASPLFDTHCHLDWFDERHSLDEVIEGARLVGVEGWIVPGVTPFAWERIASVCRRIEGAFPAFGLHPFHAHLWNDSWGERLDAICGDGVAVGEIGLDFTPGAPDRELQRRVFREQLEIARRWGKPVIIHCRKAFAETLSIIDELGRGELRGVVHAFSGSLEIAREFIRRGFLIGIAGSITFAGARKLPLVVTGVGLGHLLLETDAPDLAPQPKRGETNRPDNLPLIAQAIGAWTGDLTGRVAEVTTRAARTLFLA
ncbi:MAG: TatD family hydrolase [Desulfuromonadia bacterium]